MIGPIFATKKALNKILQILMLQFLFLLFSVSYSIAGEKQPVPIHAMPFAFGDEPDGNIYIRGSWSEENKSYNPIEPNISEITCSKNESGCTVATAYVSGPVLDIGTDYFSVIINWDVNEIIAQNIMPSCVNQRLVINKKLKTVKMFDIPKGHGDSFYMGDKFCEEVVGSDKKIHSRTLIDGQKAWQQEIKKNCKKYFEKCD